MHAVMKQAALPATNARKATWAKSLCRSGAIVERAAICVPIDPGLEKPHNAYVAIVSARFYITQKKPNYFILVLHNNNTRGSVMEDGLYYNTEMIPWAMYSDNLL